MASARSLKVSLKLGSAGSNLDAPRQSSVRTSTCEAFLFCKILARVAGLMAPYLLPEVSAGLLL